MIDVLVSYNKYKFIGSEFLTWLFFIIENNEDFFKKINKRITFLKIGNRIVMENIKKDSDKTIIIKGNNTNIEEGMTALRMGAVVSELGLLYKNNKQEWSFTLKSKDLSFNYLKVPKIAKNELISDFEEIFLEKVYFYNESIFLLDILFEYFIKLRLSERWENTTVNLMKIWINNK